MLSAGKDTQLCAPCRTSEDCGPLGAHLTLPQALGGLDKGHILYAHYPTVCHQRACVPHQVPAKDGFCRALHSANEAAEQERVAAAAARQQQQEAGFSLSRLAQKLYGRGAGGKAGAAAQPARRQLQERTQQQRPDFAPAPGPSSRSDRPSNRASAQPSDGNDNQQQQQQQQQHQGLVGGPVSTQNTVYDRFGNPYVRVTPPTTLSAPASSGAQQQSSSPSGSSSSGASTSQQQQPSRDAGTAPTSPSSG